jgi:hypothetical protein
VACNFRKYGDENVAYWARNEGDNKFTKQCIHRYDYILATNVKKPSVCHIMGEEIDAP